MRAFWTSDAYFSVSSALVLRKTHHFFTKVHYQVRNKPICDRLYVFTTIGNKVRYSQQDLSNDLGRVPSGVIWAKAEFAIVAIPAFLRLKVYRYTRAWERVWG